MFQSLIGILVDCNMVRHHSAELEIEFQSLIGILVDCNQTLQTEVANEAGFNP